LISAYTPICHYSTLKKKEPDMNTQEKIKEQVTTHPVVLYMKGTPSAPQCGFSAHAIKVLNACGVDNVYSVDVLAEPDIRQGIKEYSNWPTIPQLYINGEFVGGSDIVSEMYQSGELQKMLQGKAGE
jgi:monothiol glutaredoxin